MYLGKFRGFEGFSLLTLWEEKGPWMAPARLNPGLEGANRMFVTGRRILSASGKGNIKVRRLNVPWEV
jgi:hypothetical protein